MDQAPLIVLGADLDGLAAALSLAHQGFPVHVLERGGRTDASPDAAVLTPAAVQALAVLGLGEPVVDRAAEPAELIHADGDTGAVLRKIALGAAVRERFGQPYLTVRRSDLRAVLVAACDVDDMIHVEYGHRTASVEDLGEGVLVTDGEGRRYRSEALVAADGASSRVRELLGGGHAASLPFVVHTGPGPPSTVGVRMMRLWSSPSLLVVQMPIAEHGSEVAVVVRGDLYDEMRQRDGDRALSQMLARHCPDVRAVADGAMGGVGRIFRHHAPLERWTRHRMTVLGAAGSPMLPHAALATPSALVDAGALGAAFDRADGRILPAFDAYARSRARPSARSAERSHEFAMLCHSEGLLRRLRDLLWGGGRLDALAAVADLPGSG